MSASAKAGQTTKKPESAEAGLFEGRRKAQVSQDVAEAGLFEGRRKPAEETAEAGLFEGRRKEPVPESKDKKPATASAPENEAEVMLFEGRRKDKLQLSSDSEVSSMLMCRRKTPRN